MFNDCLCFLRDRSGTGAGLAMEGQLSARDRIGVQDFVLLEDYMSETAFVDNLQKRFKENLIYVRRSFMTRMLLYDKTIGRHLKPLSSESIVELTVDMF